MSEIYRVTAIRREGVKVVLSEHLTRDRAESVRDALKGLLLTAFKEILVELEDDDRVCSPAPSE